MPNRFDIEGYRAAKRLAGLQPLTATMGTIVNALASRENINLWKQGIEKFDPASGSEAFSHFEGFRRTVVEEAALAASQATGDGRFAANDLEEALSPTRVAGYLSQCHSDATEGDLRRVASTYLYEAFTAAAAARHDRAAGSAPKR